MKLIKNVIFIVIYFLFSFMLRAKEFDYSVLKDNYDYIEKKGYTMSIDTKKMLEYYKIV